MDTKRLRYFLGVAEAESISKASDVLNISQPSISRQINLLEGELGTRLFNRKGGGVELTPTGEFLYQQISTPFRRVEQVLREIRERSDEDQGTLVLALCPSVTHLLAGRLRKRIATSMPNLAFKIIEDHAGETAQALYFGKIDIAMLCGPPSSWQAMPWYKFVADVEVQNLLTEDLLVVGPKNSKFDVKKGIDEGELKHLDFVLMDDDFLIQGIRELINKIKNRYDEKFDYIRLDSHFVAKGIVESGDAYSLFALSSIHHELNMGKIKAFRINGANVKRNFVLGTSPKTQFPRNCKKVIESIKTEVAYLVSSGNWPGNVEIEF